MPQGEPFRKVKEKATYMLGHIPEESWLGYTDLHRVIERLIETAPQQALDALCEVLDD